MPTLRLLSYNVRSLRDDKAGVARVVSSAEPDVVCIQEAPRFLRWRSKCAALARTSGLVVVGGGRRAGANLIMSSLRVDVESVQSVPFSTDPGLHHRGTAIAVLRLGSSRFAVAGTHLDVKPEPRLRHVGELHAALERLVPAGVPAIVAGDINDKPGSPPWSALSAARADAFAAVGHPFTSTARDPHQTIDGVFVDPAITVRSAHVIDEPDVQVASDHRPLLVELDLP
ncbi:MAG TPA: endonuclease/exonuclease/phosphatase family protein [Jatrophihabitantaceae bacterium]|nr:endonuclease/exonuclease/phosphatase family protein [Jatrophihabitantaceae bacterium]